MTSADFDDSSFSQATGAFQAITGEWNKLSGELEAGEPAPPRTPRKSFGLLLKRRLYRLLWWQNHQIKAMAHLMLRQSREETRLADLLVEKVERSTQRVRHNQSTVETLSQNIARLNQQMIDSYRMVFEARQQARETSTRLQHVDQHQTETLQAEKTALREELNALRSELNGLNASLSAQLTQNATQGAAAQQEFSGRLSELGLFTHQTRTGLSLQERRLDMFIEEARKRLPEPFSADQLQEMADVQARHKYDHVYLAFEDVFRGSQDQIKARQAAYLPTLRENHIGCEEMPILDLGCGRGEWLEVLREQDLHARGLDSNEMMIEACRSAGLQVDQGEALEYLSGLPDASLGAISSFHMVEHMPFDTVLALVDESLRVLKPGGLIILETPNPANLLVGAYSFYLDPSHLKPLPSPMLRFFVEARGFCQVQVRESSPVEQAAAFPDDGTEVARRLNTYLYGPQDYAVIGKKP